MKNSKKEIAEELNEIAPFLAKLSKEKTQDKSLPADYFNNFEHRLMSRIQEEEALTPKPTIQQPKETSFWAKISWIFDWKYSAAWSFAIVVGLIGLNVLSQTPETVVQQSPDELLAALTDEDLNTYINEHIEEFSTEDIIETMTPETLEQLPSSERILTDAKISTEAPKLSIDDLTEEEILNALDDDDLEELEELF